ncbi:MAG: RNA polymerase subunit sigma-24 [Flavobacteriaceae bacterium]|nr:RNA polymerase subunit sigma-24 [Flavobacteriaceae bacterium]|tara:strand:- start:212 stop:805 length:594 start_codon:yes stop_codon:yes gene_type:complete
MHPSNNNYNSDSILVENYIGGDESSLEKLIRKHKSRIYNFIFSKVLNRDIAEDIFQDTFIKVIKTLKRGFYNEEGKFLPWIMRIAHNLVIDHFRRNNRIPKFESNNDYDIFQNLSDSSLNAEKSIIKDQVSSDLQVLVEELPSDQKDVVIMRLYRDMSFKEIAENTGVSINTALGRMRYAIINLRKMINDNQIILSH